MKKTAIIFGATGLVGSELIHSLNKDLYVYERVIAVVRNKRMSFEKNTEGRVEYRLSDFTLETLKSQMTATDLFYCLGTTLKKAGSASKFTEIELGLAQRTLKVAAEQGVKHVYLVSSMGANSKSPVLYSRIKGEIEDFARGLNFETLAIVRPSLLLGERSETRFAEELAQKVSRPLSKLFIGPLLKYKPVTGRCVAQSLLKIASFPIHGQFVFENDELHLGVVVRQISPEETYPLRHKILRPHQPIEMCRYEDDSRPGAFSLGAYRDGKLVGVVSASEESYKNFNQKKQYRIRGMATVPEVRGMGYGAALLLECVKRLQSQKVDVVWFNAREVAFGFYEKLGFEYCSDMFEIKDIGPHKVMYAEVAKYEY